MHTPEIIPAPKVTGGKSTKLQSKGKLVIFDDEPDLLRRFVQQYNELGYSVTGVLVLQRTRDRDRDLFIDGKLKHELTPEESAHEHAWHPKGEDSPHFRTIERALAAARFTNEADVDAEHDRQYYSDASHFIYGVKTKDEARQLLDALKPDFVLSDMQMRRPTDADSEKSKELLAADPDIIMGDHIMQMASEMKPAPIRAIHTGQYTISDQRMEDMRRKHNNDEMQIVAELKKWRERYAALHAKDDAAARPFGYRIHMKDAETENATATALDTYFQNKGRDREEGPAP